MYFFSKHNLIFLKNELWAYLHKKTQDVFQDVLGGEKGLECDWGVSGYGQPLSQISHGGTESRIKATLRGGGHPTSSKVRSKKCLPHRLLLLVRAHLDLCLLDLA